MLIPASVVFVIENTTASPPLSIVGVAELPAVPNKTVELVGT